MNRGTNSNSNNPETRKQSKQQKPPNITISTSSQVFMTLGTYSVNPGLQTATAKSKDVDTSLHQIEHKKKTPTNNGLRDMRVELNDHKKIQKQGLFRETAQRENKSGQAQPRAMSGSSSTTAKMKQMLKQQNDQRQSNKESREIYSINLKQIGNKPQANNTHHRPAVRSIQVKNDTSMNKQALQNYNQSVDLSIPVSGRNQGTNFQSNTSNNPQQVPIQNTYTNLVQKGWNLREKEETRKKPGGGEHAMQGMTPRVVSDNQNFGVNADNNIVNTSACNQSVQLGYSVNQGMMSGGVKQNRGGSNTSSTNQAKGRFRSGSNKISMHLNNKNQDASENLKKITINTNNAQIYMEQNFQRKGSHTTKSAIEPKSLNLKTAKSKHETGQPHISFKNSTTPNGVKNATKISKNFISSGGHAEVPHKKQANSKTEVKSQQIDKRIPFVQNHEDLKYKQLKIQNNYLEGFNFKEPQTTKNMTTMNNLKKHQNIITGAKLNQEIINKKSLNQYNELKTTKGAVTSFPWKAQTEQNTHTAKYTQGSKEYLAQMDIVHNQKIINENQDKSRSHVNNNAQNNFKTLTDEQVEDFNSQNNSLKMKIQSKRQSKVKGALPAEAIEMIKNKKLELVLNSGKTAKTKPSRNVSAKVDSLPDKNITHESTNSREASKINVSAKNKFAPNKLKLFTGKTQVGVTKKTTQIKSAERVNQQQILKDTKVHIMPQTSKSQQQQGRLIVKQKVGVTQLGQPTKKARVDPILDNSQPGLNMSSEMNDIKSAGSSKSRILGKKLGLNINNINFNFQKQQIHTVKSKDQQIYIKMPVKESLSPMMGKRGSNLLKKETMYSLQTKQLTQQVSNEIIVKHAPENPSLMVPPGTIIRDQSNNNIIINPEPVHTNIKSGNFISPMSNTHDLQVTLSNKMSRQISQGSLYAKLEQGKAQTTQKSMPNLKKNQLKINQNQSEAHESQETDQQLRFYKEELRKRDDIVMFLCKKMKGMESKINLLTKQYQQTNDQEVSYVQRQATDSDFEKMLSPQPRNQVLSTEQTYENQGGEFIKALGNMVKPLSKIGGIGDNTLSSNQTAEILQQMLSLSKTGKSADQNLEEMQKNIYQRLIEQSMDQSQSEIFNQSFHDSSKLMEQPTQKVPVTDSNLRQHSKFQKIEKGIGLLQDQLNKYNQLNNPKRIADLRRYCATSITHTTKTISEGMTSRLLQSGSNSGGQSKHLTTTRHCKSVSDVDKNSLITIDENNVHMNRWLADKQSKNPHETTKDERQSFTFQLESKQNLRSNHIFSQTEGDNEIKDLENLMNHAQASEQTQGKLQQSDKKKEMVKIHTKELSKTSITEASLQKDKFNKTNIPGIKVGQLDLKKLSINNNFAYSDDLNDSAQYPVLSKKPNDSNDNFNESSEIMKVPGRGQVTKIKKANIQKLNLNKINIKVQQQNDVRQKVKLISKVNKSKSSARGYTSENTMALDKAKLKAAGDRTGVKVNNFFNMSQSHEEEKMSDKNVHSMERQLQQLNDLDNHEQFLLSQELSAIENNTTAQHYINDNSIESNNLGSATNQSIRGPQGYNGLVIGNSRIPQLNQGQHPEGQQWVNFNQFYHNDQQNIVNSIQTQNQLVDTTFQPPNQSLQFKNQSQTTNQNHSGGSQNQSQSLHLNLSSDVQPVTSNQVEQTLSTINMSGNTSFPNNSGFALMNLQKKSQQIASKHKQSHSQYANMLNQASGNPTVQRNFKKKKNNVLSFDLTEDEKAAMLQNTSKPPQTSGISNVMKLNLQNSMVRNQQQHFEVDSNALATDQMMYQSSLYSSSMEPTATYHQIPESAHLQVTDAGNSIQSSTKTHHKRRNAQQPSQVQK